MGSIKHLFDQGDPLLYVLLAFFIIGSFLFIRRFLYLHSVSIDSEGFMLGIRNNVNKNKYVEAISLCRDTNSPVASVCESILTRKSRNEEHLHYAAEEAALIEIPKLQNNIRLISALSNIAPYMGFLGTIISIGMWFNSLDKNDNSLAMSIRDISSTLGPALYTTAAGIICSIVLYLYAIILQERCHAIIADMEYSATELINMLIEPEDIAAKLNEGILETDELSEQQDAEQQDAEQQQA